MPSLSLSPSSAPLERGLDEELSLGLDTFRLPPPLPTPLWLDRPRLRPPVVAPSSSLPASLWGASGSLPLPLSDVVADAEEGDRPPDSWPARIAGVVEPFSAAYVWQSTGMGPTNQV